MIDQNNVPKIIDFGLGRDTQNGKRFLNSMVGSKLYMAPEIIQGDPHGVSVDIWSIGIILY
jgi:serine/threonine protein kinase